MITHFKGKLLPKLEDDMNFKIQQILIDYGVHDILDAAKTAELAEELKKLITKT